MGALSKDVDPAGLIAAHPLHEGGYDFKVPLLEGEHVTEDTGTGFVHTAPGHGADDFEIWTAKARYLRELGIDPEVPDTVGPDGYYRKAVPLFGGDGAEARHRRQGPFRQARRRALRQRGGHRGAEGGGRARRHEPAPQARLRAFLAVEGADHLSQHAAMVHRDGQAERDESGQERQLCATLRSPPSTRRASCRRKGRNRLAA